MRHLLLPLAILFAGCAAPFDPPVCPEGERTAPPAAEAPVIGAAWSASGELPRHVVAPAGQVTLFADFANPTEGGIPVYLVNRTKAAIPLHAQDGDLYLKLEYESEPGVWTRAQGHSYSWCGNSYSTRVLEPDRFAVITGRRPAGREATVRYRFYGQEVAAESNSGAGRVAPAEVEAAANDRMSVQGGGFTSIRRVLWDERERGARFAGMLGRLLEDESDPAKTDKLLEALAAGSNEWLAEAARRQIDDRKKRGR